MPNVIIELTKYYPMDMKRHDMVFIGTTSMDFWGYPNKTLVMEDTNAGQVHSSIGGVMHNIVLGANYAGLDPFFITAIGEDKSGEMMKQELKVCNIDFLSPKTDFPSARYVAVLKDNAELQVGVMDNRIFSAVDTEFLQAQKDFISLYDDIVFDSNLPEETIAYLMDTYKGKKLYAEAFSTSKALRFRSHVSGLYLFIANILETEAVLGNFVASGTDLVKALLNKGVQNAVVTAGKEGVYFGNKSGVFFQPSTKGIKIVSTEGCGDALAAFVITSLYRGKNLSEAVNLGMKAADIIIQSEKSTSARLKELAIK